MKKLVIVGLCGLSVFAYAAVFANGDVKPKVAQGSGSALIVKI